MILDGKYWLEALLSQGGNESVFRAVHIDLNKTFVVKLLATVGVHGPREAARFRHEADELENFAFSGIAEVAYFGVDNENNWSYLVLDLEGESLQEVLRTKGPLPLEQTLTVLTGIAAAVDTAHVHEILHRDLRSNNVFLHNPQETDPVKIDFGLAIGHSKGQCPIYAPWAVIPGRSDGRFAASYSLAMLAYEILTGHLPPTGLSRHIGGWLPSIPGLPPAVSRALAELMDQPFPSATKGIRWLQEAILGAAQESARGRGNLERIEGTVLHYNPPLLAAVGHLFSVLLGEGDKYAALVVASFEAAARGFAAQEALLLLVEEIEPLRMRILHAHGDVSPERIRDWERGRCPEGISRAIDCRRAELIEDSRFAGDAGRTRSLANSEPSVLCVPILDPLCGAVVGVIYFRNDSVLGAYTPRDLAWLQEYSAAMGEVFRFAFHQDHQKRAGEDVREIPGESKHSEPLRSNLLYRLDALRYVGKYRGDWL
jgi:serine/threonine protein kinase